MTTVQARAEGAPITPSPSVVALADAVSDLVQQVRTVRGLAIGAVAGLAERIAAGDAQAVADGNVVADAVEDLLWRVPGIRTVMPGALGYWGPIGGKHEGDAS